MSLEAVKAADMYMAIQTCSHMFSSLEVTDQICVLYHVVQGIRMPEPTNESLGSPRMMMLIGPYGPS